MPTTASTRIFASVAASSDPLPPSLPHLRHHLALRKCLPPEASAFSKQRAAAPSVPSRDERYRGGPVRQGMRRRPAGAVRPAIRSVVFGGNPRSDICSLRYLYLQAFYYRRERVFRRKDILRERACELAQKERERVRKRDRKKRRNNQSCTRAAHNACKSSSLAQVHPQGFSHLVL
jgi:hypothetical protein